MKFKTGEIAILINDKNGFHPETIGWEVEIKKAGVVISSHDYLVIDSTGKLWLAYESELEKKKPPKEDASWERIQELTKWNPTKEKVSHE